VIVAAGAAASQAPPKTAPTVKEVMVTMTIPASDAIFSAVSEPPTETAQWVALRASAKTLADSGRVLTTTTRIDEGEWVEMARALVNASEAMFKPIEKKDVDALSQASDRLYVTCETCHKKYMN
jgi:hypothetical protein